MRTIRRLYFYLVALISLEIVIWGVISLARTVVGEIPATSLLASGLALVLVGIPIFLLHWLTAQRDASRDDEERSSVLRALFFYGARLSVLIPVVSSLIALFYRLFLGWMGRLMTSGDFPGGGQTNADNLIAVVVHLGVFLYLEYTLRADWQEPELEKTALVNIRRLYRYIWLVMSLGIVIEGVRELLQYAFHQPGTTSYAPEEWLARGAALLLIAVPVWSYTGRLIQKSMSAQEERRASLALGIPYGIAVISAAACIGLSANLADSVFRWVLGEIQTFSDFLLNNTNGIAWLVPLVVTWGYYQSRMQAQIAREAEELRRAAQQRLYLCILALVGLVAVFLGGWALLTGVVEMLVNTGFFQEQRDLLAYGFGWLLVGLPAWLWHWRNLQEEAYRMDAMGDHARRSVARKGLLYLVLFVLVVAAMLSAGSAVYLAASALLGNPLADFTLTFSQRTQTFGWVMLWLVYHLNILRGDGRRAAAALAERHALYPVLLVHDASPAYVGALEAAIRKQTPRLPLMVCDFSREPITDGLASARAVVLPASLALNPPESLRVFLSKFTGQRLVVNLPVEGWTWLGAVDQETYGAAREAARVVAQMAEGQQVRPRLPLAPLSVAAYVLGGLFLAELLFMLLMMGVSFFVD